MYGEWRMGVMHSKGRACVAKGSVHGKEGGGGFVHGRKACMEGGVCMARGDVRAGETATEAADMHPTGLI